MKKYFALLLGGLYLLSGCGGGASSPPPPTMSLAPAGLNFGVSVIGTGTAPQVETLTNTGSSDLAISGVTIGGTNAADFTFSNTCGASLAAGEHCNLSVTFTPSQLGQRSASLTVTDGGVGSPQMLSLSGMGGDSGPNATFSPTTLNLGNEVIGTTSKAQTITLYNYGSADLSITNIATSTVFAETNNCSPTLAAGASCTINVTFTPSAAGSVTGSLSVTDSGPGSPQTVPLSGTGTTNNDTLTGYCFGSVYHGAPQQCGVVQDLTQCPAGQLAIKPTYIVGCFPPESELVDSSRTCHAGRVSGYCAAKY
ncbi:MAG: choice-of-anchor D domain-containing protein [Terriglobales bacterium]